MAPAAGDHQEQGAALRIAAFRMTVAKSPADLRPAKQACDFELGRKPVAAQWLADSGGVALIGPHQHRRQAHRGCGRRASFRASAPCRVTRLTAASAFRCSAPASGGDRSRNTRSTGRPSIAL